MSIETTLTWGVALALLAGALVIRTIALGLYRLGLFIWMRLGGPAPAWRAADVREALPSIPLRERLANLGEAFGAAAIFVAAHLARGVELTGRGLAWALERTARTAEAVYLWSAPRTRSAWAWTSPRVATGARNSGRGLRSAWAWLFATVTTFFRSLRSRSHPGSTRRVATVATTTYPASRVAAARVARARSNSGTRAGAA